MVFGLVDIQNDCSFAVKFDDVSKLDLVKQFAVEGLSTWYEAANEDIEANEYFTKEEIEGFYESGYAEPTSELLDRYGIRHEIIDIKCDENDIITNCDEVAWY